eukprot:TRINITY_DN10267_c0_g1_i3.p1 TRINITY_DN10267_c0_g1~~TRINITY_DN10267_c0_g1_i3.p1  ORF type:complete len:300 (+),score=63.49 TRINITY_DN10267_c0_g1_i3:1-900(+)
MRAVFVVAFSAALMITGVIIAVSVKVSDSRERQYGIMLDAGSSGTRLYVYNWPERFSDSLPLVRNDLDQEFENDTYGISDFASDPAGVAPYIRDLVASALPYVPQNKQARTPIYLKATAGMRLLPTEEQDAILAEIRTTLREFPFPFEDSDIRVITGQEEALYGWVTVNFLLDTLDDADAADTFGAMDLGGASTQNTFSTNPAPAPPALYGGLDLTLGGVDHSIYAVSYLGFGRDEAQALHHSRLVAGLPSGSAVVDPCAHSGYNSTFIDDNSNTYFLLGASDYASCRGFTVLFIISLP